MKKKIAVLSAIAIIISVSVVGTLAYFTAEDKADNIITVGNVDIELVEKTIDPDDPDEPKDFPEEGFKDIVPNTSVSKIVSIKNTGANAAWVRIKIEKRITSQTGKALPLVLDNGKEVMELDFDTTKWIEGNDGYYYYSEPVLPGASTIPLFENVKFAPEFGNEYAKSKMEIDVSAHAVQSENNPIPAGKDVTAVKGWPEEVSE